MLLDTESGTRHRMHAREAENETWLYRTGALWFGSQMCSICVLTCSSPVPDHGPLLMLAV